MRKRHVVRKSFEIAWELMKCAFQIIRGYVIINRLNQPCVTIFGSSKMKLAETDAQAAGKLAHILVTEHFSVLTGGGPGVMEAATCGANTRGVNGKRVIKIAIRGLSNGQADNKCPGQTLHVDYFFVRKWLLIDYSIAFVFFPGGFGTFDELSDAINLIQTGKIHDRVIVLYDTKFWQPYLALLQTAHERKLLNLHALNLLVTDDLQETVDKIKHYCHHCGRFPNLTP